MSRRGGFFPRWWPHERSTDTPQRRQAAVTGGIEVIVDASYRNQRAGLAMIGALGERSEARPARSSVEAEFLALVWAMQHAEQAGAERVNFYTDCQALAEYGRGGAGVERDSRKAVRAYMRAHQEWSVVQVQRATTAEADRMAGLAREGRRQARLRTEIRAAKHLAETTRESRQWERENLQPRRRKRNRWDVTRGSKP